MTQNESLAWPAAVSFFPIHKFITGRIDEMRDGTGLGTTFIV